MRTKFNSAICTSREQSEQLLSLGLKKETADIVIRPDNTLIVVNENSFIYYNLENAIQEGYFPAWSLHRLIEMIPNRIKYKNDYYHFNIFSEITRYIVDYVDPDDNYYNLLGHRHNNLFEGVISLIEWLIKEEYFNKEYLEE